MSDIMEALNSFVTQRGSDGREPREVINHLIDVGYEFEDVIEVIQRSLEQDLIYFDEEGMIIAVTEITDG